MEAQATQPKLNEAQLMLLKIFSREVPPEAMKELNRLLVEFYDNLVQLELEKLQASKPITQADLDRLQTTHPKRTPYKP
jgi:hypothetical protein